MEPKPPDSCGELVVRCIYQICTSNIPRPGDRRCSLACTFLAC